MCHNPQKLREVTLVKIIYLHLHFIVQHTYITFMCCSVVVDYDYEFSRGDYRSFVMTVE